MFHSFYRPLRFVVPVFFLLAAGMAGADQPKARIAILGGTFLNDIIFHRDGLIQSEFTIDTKVGKSPTIYYAEHNGIPFYYIHAHGQGKWLDTDIRAILLEQTRKAILDNPDYEDISIHDGGTVLQSRGGRFETVAEVEMMARMGGDLVTMNIASEMAYSRMLGINYAAIGVISNPAEGRADWDFSLMEELYPRVNPLSLDIVLASLPAIAKLQGKPRVSDGLINHPEMTSQKKQD